MDTIFQGDAGGEEAASLLGSGYWRAGGQSIKKFLDTSCKRETKSNHSLPSEFEGGVRGVGSGEGWIKEPGERCMDSEPTLSIKWTEAL